MNQYSKILIINFIIINLIGIVFSVFITNGFTLAIPVIVAVTLAVTYVIAKSLINRHPEMKKTVVIISVPVFVILSIINLIVAAGTVRLLAEVL